MRAHVVARHVGPHDGRPRRARAQRAVALGKACAELRKARPRNAREVVVLRVVAHVPRDEIPRSVVGEGLLRGRLLVEDVVLGQEVAGARMQAAGEEDAEEREAQRRAPGHVDEGHVECELHTPRREVPPRRYLRPCEHGPHGVGHDLQGAPREFGPRATHPPEFPLARKVRVLTAHAQRPVVCEVVRPEVHTEGHDEGRVGHEGEQPVPHGSAEEEVVREFVHCEKERLHERGPHCVGREEVRGPRPPRSRETQRRLCGHESEAYPLASPLVARERRHFFFEDGRGEKKTHMGASFVSFSRWRS